MSYLILIWREKEIAQKQKQQSQEKLELRVSLFCLNEMKWNELMLNAYCIVLPLSLSLNYLLLAKKEERTNSHAT